MTLQDYRNQVNARLQDYGFKKFPAEMIDDTVNMVRNTLVKLISPQRFQRWYYTLSVESQEKYNLANIPESGSDKVFNEILFMYDGTELTVKTFSDMNEEHSGWRDVDDGTPQYAIMWGNILLLNPPPDTADLVIDALVLLKPDNLTSDSSECDIPQEYQKYVPTMAVYEITQNEQAISEMEQKFMALHKKELNRGYPVRTASHRRR